MDTGRNDLLGEIAADAALERSDFLVQATEQLRRFLDRHKERIAAFGGLTLIDDEPDYLSIAPDWLVPQPDPLPRRPDRGVGQRDRGHRIRGRARRAVQPGRPVRGLREAAQEAAGYGSEPTAADDLIDVAGIAPEETVQFGEDPYAAAADSWAAGQSGEPLDDEESGRPPPVRHRPRVPGAQPAQRGAPARASSRPRPPAASGLVGELIIVDDDDERLVAHLDRRVPRRGRPRGGRSASGGALSSAEELVEFYDPTDVFGDLADALAEAFPVVAPELAAAEASDDADRRRRGGRRGRGRGRRRGRRGRGRRRRRRRRSTDRVTMRLAAAELVDSREILPGQWLQAYPRARTWPAGSRAGQFVHIRAGDYSGLVLRRPFS